MDQLQEENTLALVALSAYFWLTFTLMVGTLYEKSSGVITIPIGLFFAMWLLPSTFTPLMYITPVILTVGPGESDGFQECQHLSCLEKPHFLGYQLSQQ